MASCELSPKVLASQFKPHLSHYAVYIYKRIVFAVSGSYLSLNNIQEAARNEPTNIEKSSN